MQIKSAAVGPLRTNCYFLIDDTTKECILIDPGEEADRLSRLLEREGLSLVAILLTHGHFDHIGAVSELASKYCVTVIAGENEAELLQDPELNESLAMGHPLSVKPAQTVRDGDIITIKGFKCRVIEPPGHTAGGVTYYFEGEDAAFAGDTIFLESVGRSDLHTGNGDKLVQSIKEKLFVLPKKTVIYPGHGPKTTVDYEMKNNPYL